jgi:hypothetical protein
MRIKRCLRVSFHPCPYSSLRLAAIHSTHDVRMRVRHSGHSLLVAMMRSEHAGESA